MILEAEKVVTMDLKEPGNRHLPCRQKPAKSWGGAHVWKACARKALQGDPPRVHVSEAKETFLLMYEAIRKGFIRAAHDLSEGGLAVTAAEMAFAGDWGMDIDLRKALIGGDLSEAALLFSETPSRFLVEVPDIIRPLFETMFKGRAARLGRVTTRQMLKIRNGAKRIVLDEPIGTLGKAWNDGKVPAKTAKAGKR